MNLSATLLEKIFPVQYFDIWSYLLKDAKAEPLTLAYLLFVVIFLGPVAEEIFFRVYWFGRNIQKNPFWRSAAIPSLAFAMLHAFVSPLGIAILFGIGVLLCWIYHRSRTPFSITSFHSGINFTAVILYFLFPGVSP